MFKKLPRNTRILEKELERKKEFSNIKKIGIFAGFETKLVEENKKEEIVKKYLRNLEET